MATVKEIENARQGAVERLDEQVIEAGTRRNATNAPTTIKKLDRLVDRLMLARTRLNTAAVAAQDSSPQMRAALKVLKDIAADLDRVADHEKTLSDFLRIAGAYAGAAAKLATALT